MSEEQKRRAKLDRLRAKKREQLRPSIEARVQIQKRTFEIQQELSSNECAIAESRLSFCSAYLQPVHYDEIVEERSTGGYCGFPLCNQALADNELPKYRISLKERKVYDQTEMKFYCSEQCLISSKLFRSQLSEEPVHLRALPSENTVIRERQPREEEIRVPQPKTEPESAQTIEGYAVKLAPKEKPQFRPSRRPKDTATTPAAEASATTLVSTPDSGEPTPTIETTSGPTTSNTVPKTRKVREKKKTVTFQQPERPSEPVLESNNNHLNPINKETTPSGSSSTNENLGKRTETKGDEAVKTEVPKAAKPKKQYAAELSPFATIWLALSTWVTSRTRSLLRNDVNPTNETPNEEQVDAPDNDSGEPEYDEEEERVNRIAPSLRTIAPSTQRRQLLSYFLSKSLVLVRDDLQIRPTVEKDLSKLIYTFDLSREVASHLTTPHWTIILLILIEALSRSNPEDTGLKANETVRQALLKRLFGFDNDMFNVFLEVFYPKTDL